MTLASRFPSEYPLLCLAAQLSPYQLFRYLIHYFKSAVPFDFRSPCLPSLLCRCQRNVIFALLHCLFRSSFLCCPLFSAAINLYTSRGRKKVYSLHNPEGFAFMTSSVQEWHFPRLVLLYLIEDFPLTSLFTLFALFAQKCVVVGPGANSIYSHQRWDKGAITNLDKLRQRICKNYMDKQRCKGFYNKPN